jgi:uncharacterized protein (DUF934 family)
LRPERAVTLIRDGAIVAHDPWIMLADDAPIPMGARAIIVSFARLKAEHEVLAHAGVELGVHIAPGDNVDEIAGELHSLSLVEVAFPGFRDGRGYSTARILRTRLNYRGEMRAVGDVLRDQVFLMLRVGFNAFVIKDNDAADAVKRASALHRDAYQVSSDARVPIWALRAAASHKAAAE